MPTSACEADAFVATAFQNSINRVIAERLPALGLKDAWLVAGCLFQTAWNIRAGQRPTAGIRDYDIFYFDGDDLSWDAEDAHIQRLREVFADLPVQVELKNQARVHLWYAERFGAGYPQLGSSGDGIDRFLIACTRVGLKPHADSTVELYAPDGLTDLYDGVLRPNPLNYRPHLFHAKAASYQERWPWLTRADARPAI